jgi:predicted ATP-grasp superfamily ATP-dependent carboligase
MDNLIDLLLTISVILPTFLVLLSIAGLVVYAVTKFWPDDNDRKLKEYEQLRHARLKERMEQEPTDLTLAAFYDSYQDEPLVPQILPDKPKRKPRTKKIA